MPPIYFLPGYIIVKDDQGNFIFHQAVPEAERQRLEKLWSKELAEMEHEPSCPQCTMLKEKMTQLLEKLDWQNMPNCREPLRGGYEFYINEEWTGIRDAALHEDAGFQATLMKTRYDPDDKRVRVRRVFDDDAILRELANLKSSNPSQQKP